jgi:SAM-dependent methyltransferase
MDTNATQANQEQIRYWNEESGPKWVRLQQQLDSQLAPFSLAVLQQAGAKLGEHILDVGCGCGQTSLELAGRVGPQGSVIGLDISQPMLTRARERQKELAIANLEFIHADAQTYSFERERFDLIFSRFGVMFFDDPTAAFRNLRTAIRSNGSAFSAGKNWQRTTGRAFPSRRPCSTSRPRLHHHRMLQGRLLSPIRIESVTFSPMQALLMSASKRTKRLSAWAEQQMLMKLPISLLRSVRLPLSYARSMQRHGRVLHALFENPSSRM